MPTLAHWRVIGSAEWLGSTIARLRPTLIARWPAAKKFRSTIS